MKSAVNRKLSALFLVLVMLISLVTPVLAAEAEEDTEKTEVTEETQPQETKTPYEVIYIRNVDDLLELADNCRLDTWSLRKMVVLQTDLSLENTDFLTIPSFGGVFNGNGHTISGLYITGSVTPAGLFGQLQVTGVIKNLTVSGTVTPSGDASFVGGIVGENYGTITDCNFTGNITGSSSVGGIAGVNTVTGKIVGCESSGTILGSDMTGGITGCNLGIVGSCVNKAYVNTVSIDPTINPEDISFDFLTDISKLSSLDTSMAAMDTGGIAGYSSGILEGCTNKETVGYPHIGYNVGGIAGRNCGYLHDCENTAQIYGRKDVGGITGQMEPYIVKNLTESSLAKLERQLDELDVLLDQAMEHADGAANSIAQRLNSIAGSMGAAGAAAQDIRTSGTVTSTVTGSGEAGGEGSVTVTPAEGNAGSSITVGDGSVSVEVGGSISSGIEGEGSAAGNGSLDAQTQISITTNLAGLSSAIYGMAGQMSMLSGEVSSSSGELYADVELIRAKISEITDTAFEMILGDDEDDVVIDSSEIDIDLVTLGKVSACVNSGAVNGDINVGGITGAMAMEYELDPEDDVTVRIDSSQRSKYEVKAIILKCENIGTVTSKRNYAGGIAGKMDLGLIVQCESYGSISSENGDYVGGIAGIACSTVRHSFAKCTLSGRKYVGGIVGSGVEEDRNGGSSTVAACYAIVTITDYKQYAGAISGSDAGTYLENYFVSEDLAGINRISYSGEAEPIAYETLIQLFAAAAEAPGEEAEPGEGKEETAEAAGENGDAEEIIVVPPVTLPEEFEKFTLKFVVDGEVIQSELFDYGASFGDEAFPEVPQKDGCFGYWDITTLENLKFDTIVTAVYDPYITALSSADIRENGKPIFFVEGLFGDEDQLNAESLALTPAEFNLPEGIWDGILKSFQHLKLNTEVVEQWQLQIPSDGQDSHTVRYLPQDGKEDHLDVYLRQNGNWKQVETEVIGNYVAFPVQGETAEIAIVSSMPVWWVWLIPVALVLGLILLIIHQICKQRKPRVQEKMSGETEKMGTDTTEVDSDIRVPPPAKPKKAKRWLVPLLILLALLVGIGGTAAFFLVPDLLSGVAAYDYLKAFAEQKELSMELRVEAEINGQPFDFTAQLDRTELEGQSVTAISESGRILYYSNGIVFLENGTAYQIGSAFPDYSQLLEKTAALYCYVEIETKEDACTITAENTDARAMLELLLPSAAALLSDTDALAISLDFRQDTLEKITFSGSGTLTDGTPYTVSAVLNCLDTPSAIQIPEVVVDAIHSGEYASLEALTADLLRLSTGLQALNDRNPLAASLSLLADCGPLTLNESLTFYRWQEGESTIFSLQENGYALYFTDEAVCDRNGSAIPLANAANIDAAKLLDISYAACMNATADCEQTGNRYVYTVTLTEDGMKQVAAAIAPEATQLDIAYESGTLTITLREETVESIELRIDGTVQIVLSSADVALAATLEFTEPDTEISLPEVVAEALGK